MISQTHFKLISSNLLEKKTDADLLNIKKGKNSKR